MEHRAHVLTPATALLIPSPSRYTPGGISAFRDRFGPLSRASPCWLQTHRRPLTGPLRSLPRLRSSAAGHSCWRCLAAEFPLLQTGPFLPPPPFILSPLLRHPSPFAPVIAAEEFVAGERNPPFFTNPMLAATRLGAPLSRGGQPQAAHPSLPCCSWAPSFTAALTVLLPAFSSVHMFPGVSLLF